MLEIIGYLAALFTTSSSIPQLIKIIKTKSAGDVSTIMFSLIVSGNVLWFIYGLNIDSNPIFYSSICAMIINVATLLARMKYKNKKPELSTSKVA